MNKDNNRVLCYGTILIVAFLFFIMVTSNNNKRDLSHYMSANTSNQLNNFKNINRGTDIREGFGNSKKNNNDNDIANIIDNKLKSLTQELGDRDGIRDAKETLKKTKKICDMECAKCMMNMLQENKGLKTINIDNLVDDDSSEDCIKCKNYTALSQSLQNAIDSL